MKNPIVECIPNFSEGRKPEVVAEIVNAIKSVEGITILDYSSDADHNRTVVTFVGSPLTVEQAAFLGIKKAADLIDMDLQTGAHPRLGATDVVPFVPISDVTMADCIEIARKLGKRVGEELDIPVYLYEKAATDPSRENLAKVRKGEYELLKKEIGTNEGRTPDYGPKVVSKAGGTIIGARSPLVAYNVYLNTDDIKVAEKIGKSVRHLSGGLRYVKGLGMLVDGQAQVSMNLTNTKKTPIHQVVEMIRSEATRYGVSITRSELIGLIPQKALIDAAVWYLQLDDFDKTQILEQKMMTPQDGKSEQSIDEVFLSDLAAGTAAPGGGSAAAYSAAMGAGLIAMAARLTVNKKKYKEVEAEMWGVIERADELRKNLTLAVQEDADSFDEVMKAFKLPKSTVEEKESRAAVISEATYQATLVPLKVASMAAEVITLGTVVTGKGNLNAISDGATGAALAKAGMEGALMNVRINMNSNSGHAEEENVNAKVAEILTSALKAETQWKSSMEERGNIKTI
jgi:glutamate formiminotransferase / formiminotetrahydrofolate cyclodeaminase